MTVGIGTGAARPRPPTKSSPSMSRRDPLGGFGLSWTWSIAVWCAIVSIGVLLQVFFLYHRAHSFTW